MIIKGGIVFMRRGDQLPEVTISGARIVMEVEHPASMEDYRLFLAHRIGMGSKVTECTFLTMQEWAQAETRDQLKASSSGKSQGWWWQQVVNRLGLS